MNLSTRLKALADMVPECRVMADVGTDHGYLPIELVKRGTVNRAYAMDINKGPLSRAQANIDRAGESEQIRTILSDGLEKLPDDTETVVIAGMGGILISRILEEGSDRLDSVSRLILSPHMDVEVFRRRVHKMGYKIDDEIMIEDQDKYYNIFSCTKGEECYTDIEYIYGKKLMERKSKVFRRYMDKLHHSQHKILDRLSSDVRDATTEEAMQKAEARNERVQEVKAKLKEIDEVMQDA